MAKYDEKILERFRELINQGEAIKHSKIAVIPTEPSGYYKKLLDPSIAEGWLLSSADILARTLGKQSDHYERLKKYIENVYGEGFESALEIMKSALIILEKGFLLEQELLIAADVFDNFLEQAKHLLDNEYKDPAASLIGAVLEASLRKLCEKKSISYSDRDTLGILNENLYKNSVYSKIQWRAIQTWTDIRNDADHGHFENYSKSQVEGMHQGVEGFIRECLG